MSDDSKENRLIYTPTDRSGSEEEPAEGLCDRPAIIVNDQLRVVAGYARDAFTRVNEELIRRRDHRAFFARGHTVCRLRISQNGLTIEPVTGSMMQLRLSSCANFYRQRGDDLVSTYPEFALAQALLGAADDLALPHLDGLITTPVYRPDLSLITQAGYDRPTGLYYIPPPELQNLSFPMNPTSEAVRAAAERFRRPFEEFAFRDVSGLANQFGAMLSPLLMQFVRHAPMYCIRAAQQAAGKTLLSQAVAVLNYGGEAPTITAPHPHSEEWGKLLISIGLQGLPIAIFDNSVRKIESGVLAQFLTGEKIEARLLRTNTVQATSTRIFVVANGNNLVVGPDMRRRSFWTVLDAQSGQLHDQHFRYHPFLKRLREERRALLEAELVMIQGWIAVGRPDPARVPIISSFESWCRTIGGVLEFAGIPGFLGNFEEMFEEVDPGEQAWEAFFTILFQCAPEQLMSSRQLLSVIKAYAVLRDTAPDELANAIKLDSPQILGTELAKVEGRRFGRQGLRIVRVRDLHTKVWLWRVTHD